MGSDDLFHKRKRRASELQRRKPNRQRYKKVLIVCEGEKTEPNYFNALKDRYQLNSVTISGESGSSPASVLKYAKQRYRESKEAGDAFDKVFCVFDQDQHETYASTLQAIRKAKPKGVFQAIPSVPCFEYWLLLHFTYTTKPYDSETPCTQVLHDLKSYMGNYAKRVPQSVFRNLLGSLDTAKANAALSLKAADNTDTNNPSTKVHELVDELQEIKQP